MGAVWVSLPEAVAVRVLAVRALTRVREDLEREAGPGWVALELEAGALLRDVCDQLGLTGREVRSVLGDAGVAGEPVTG